MTLQEIRSDRGLSQFDLAVKSGVKLSSIQKYESGAICINNARGEALYKLANALDVSIEELLELEKIQ